MKETNEERIEGEHRTSNIELRTSNDGRGESDGKIKPARRVWDLEERLLEFAANTVRVAESMPRTRAVTHVSGHLLRSGTSPLMNPGEAESAESQPDFIHKLSICLKELRETLRCLKLIRLVPLVKSTAALTPLMQENDELIRIFVQSIRTAEARFAKR
jgi:four helix bundle protein